MRNLVYLCRNLPFALSAGAYLLLAVPATEAGLLTGVLLTALCFGLSFLLPSVWRFARDNTAKGHWITAGTVCLLMGLRFDNVWKLSSQVSALTAKLNVDSSVFLTVLGCLLALGAVYFVAAVLTFLLKYPLHFLKDTDAVVSSLRISRPLLIGIVALLVIQLALLCYWGNQKQGYHVDEVYTFELSNYPDTIFGDSEHAYANWHTGGTFVDLLAPADGRLFDLSVPFWNGETDNHPSTYYILVNIFSSVFKLLGLSINKWAALIPNIICCLVTTVFFVFLLQHLLKNGFLAFCGGAVWVFCIGAINIGVYLRMYALVTMVVMIFSWLHFAFLSNYINHASMGKTLVVLQLVTIAGILCQYYFLFFAFFFCGLVCLYLFIKKDWSTLWCYMLTELSAVLAAELLFPRMIVRLLFGDRGSEALANMLNGSDFLTQVQAILQIINQELFGGYGLAVIIVGIVLLFASVIAFKVKTGTYRLEDWFALLMLLTVGGYILVVTKVAPYQVDRYFMCVFPLLILCFVYSVCHGFLSLFCKNRICVASISLVLISFALYCTVSGTVSYIYPDSIERVEIAERYADVPVVAINGDYYDDSVLQWAFEFQTYQDVFLCRNNNPSDIALATENGKLDNGFLLYVHQDTTDTQTLFDHISEWIAIENYVEITDAQHCRVFYCTLR